MRTDDWVREKLEDHDQVEACTLIAVNRLLVERKDGKSPAVVVVFKKQRLTRDLLEESIGDGEPSDFILNVPKEAVIDGDAFEFAEERRMAIGGFADLLRALNDPDVREFKNRNYLFIERGLRQHDAVTRFRRLDDRRYCISRGQKPDRVAIFLHDYELSADAIRSARDRYGAFEVVVIANPNGTATPEAHAAARSMGCRVLDYGAFLGCLNR